MESMTQPTDDVGGNAWRIVLLVLLPILVLSLMGCSTTAVGEPKIGSMEIWWRLYTTHRQVWESASCQRLLAARGRHE